MRMQPNRCAIPPCRNRGESAAPTATIDAWYGSKTPQRLGQPLSDSDAIIVSEVTIDGGHVGEHRESARGQMRMVQIENVVQLF